MTAPRSQKQHRGSKKQAKHGGNRSGKLNYCKPTEEDVLAAVRSLYADRLEPFGRILLRRVRERCATLDPNCCDLEEAPLVEPKNLTQICRACPALSVENIDGNEITVLLRGVPADFVDVTSEKDPFPQQFWDAAAGYFAGLRGKDVLLPGGRYACAQALAAKRLPWLAGRSLGEVCHFVQLAVSVRKILGYTDGNMVPYNHSEESVKAKCAAKQQPFTSHVKKTEPTIAPVRDWEKMRACLKDILHEPGVGEGSVTVSNVKMLFRSRFNLELSETALGHSRLSELLEDAMLQDICKLEVRGSGQLAIVAVPAVSVRQSPAVSAAARGAPAVPLPWEAGSLHQGYSASWTKPSPAAPPTPKGSFQESPVCLSTKPVCRSPASLPGSMRSAPPTVGTTAKARLAAAVEAVRAAPPSAVVAPPPGLESSPPLVLESCAPMAASSPMLGGDLLSAQLQLLLALDSESRRKTLAALSSRGRGDESPESTDCGSEHPTCQDSDGSGSMCHRAKQHSLGSYDSLTNNSLYNTPAGSCRFEEQFF